MIRSVLVPLDGSPLAEAAIGPAEEIASGLTVKVILLTAITPLETILRETLPWSGMSPSQHEVPVGVARQRFESEKVAATEYLAGLEARLSSKGLDCDLSVVEGGAADAILDRAQQEPDSVIIMATHGRGGLGRVLHGSVAAEVLRRCQVPLLLIRPH
jgi:nucleotide-binding universal stress UspA family protein